MVEIRPSEQVDSTGPNGQRTIAREDYHVDGLNGEVPRAGGRSGPFGVGEEVVSAVVSANYLVTLVRGRKIAFRISDRILVCPVCGGLSRVPSTVCYGCERGETLVDPLASNSPAITEIR